MPLADLNPEEREVMKGCLRATVEGPFFPDSEFHTIFGLQRDVVRDVLASWPNLDERNESVMIAINNSFNNLLGYPHGREDAWPQFIPVSAEELGRIYEKWKGKSVRNYFDGLM